MSLIYNKTNWKDDKTTPVNAKNLNNIEDGVEYIYHKWDKIIQDSTTGDHAAELIDARYGPNDTEQHPTLGHRLNHMDNKFKEVNSQLEHKANNADLMKSLDFLTEDSFSSLTRDNSKTFIDSLIKGSSTVTFWGDSITQGADFIDGKDRYVELYTDILKKEFSGVEFNIKNFGIGGRKIEHAFDANYTSPNNFSTSWSTVSGKSWREYVKDSNPDLLFIAFGMNGASSIIANKNALQGIMEYITTWDKIPTIVLITNWTPRVGYVTDEERVFRNAIASSTREYAKLSGISVLDVNRVYNLLRYGYDENVKITNKSVNFNDEWMLEGNVSGDNFSKTVNSSLGYCIRKQKAKDFKVNATFKTNANVSSVKFRNSFYILFDSILNEVRIYDYAGHRIKECKYTFADSSNISVYVNESLINVYINNVLILTVNSFYDFREGYLALGSEVGGTVISNLSINDYINKRVTPKLKDDDIVGNFVLDDYTTKLPNGGNGVNHPTSQGIIYLYKKPMLDFVNSVKYYYNYFETVLPYLLLSTNFKKANTSIGIDGATTEGRNLYWIKVDVKTNFRKKPIFLRNLENGEYLIYNSNINNQTDIKDLKENEYTIVRWDLDNYMLFITLGNEESKYNFELFM